MEGTVQVIDRLKAEGFAVSYAYLQWLLRDRQIPTPPKGFGGRLMWSEPDVQRLRGILIRRGRGPQEDGVGEVSNARRT